MSHSRFPTDNPTVITCGLPYANGDLHIGHLRTYVGVEGGQRIRHLLPDRYIEEAILVLLIIIGGRLVVTSVGV